MRLLVVSCFMVSVAGLMGIVSLFPLFIGAVVEEKNLSGGKVDNSVGSVDKNSLSEIQRKMSQSKILLDTLDKGSDEPAISDLISDVIRIREKVTITSIAANKLSSTTFSVTIQGIAPTRNDLISYKDRFVAAKPGNTAELPISELAKSANLAFSLQLKEKLP